MAPPGPWLMMATPASARRSAVRSATSVGTEPSAKAWLTATLPFRPAASVRWAIATSWAMPLSPLSCRWMSTPTPRRSAMPKIAPRWPSRSPSMPTGSSPPRRSAPSAMAASSSCGRARRAQDAALREGDDLDGDKVAEALAHLQDLVEIFQAELVVDVDMAAHVQGAAGHHLAHQVGAGLRFRDRPRRAHLALGLDAVGDAIAGRLVGHPGQAEQGLVEMDMAVDQRRQDEAALEIERVGACRRVARDREEGGDPPSLDLDVMLPAVRQLGVGEQHALTCRRRRPLPCGSARRPWRRHRHQAGSRWRW